MDGSSKPGKRALHWSRAWAVHRAKPPFALQRKSNNVFSHAESIYMAPVLWQASAEPFLALPLLTYPSLLSLCFSYPPRSLAMSSRHMLPLLPSVSFPTYSVCLENSYPDFKTSAASFWFYIDVVLYGVCLSPPDQELLDSEDWVLLISGFLELNTGSGNVGTHSIWIGRRMGDPVISYSSSLVKEMWGTHKSPYHRQNLLKIQMSYV